MLVQVDSSLETFKKLEFGPGLNVLVAEKHSGSTAKDTRNGTGKTSFVELVHFVLSEKSNKNDDFHKPELVDHTFECKFQIAEQDVVVSRESGTKDSTLYNSSKIEPSEMRKVLMKEWFGWSENSQSQGNFEPKFSALLSFSARKDRIGGFASPITNSAKQQAWDSQVCLSYLLGFNWNLPQKLQIIKEQKKNADLFLKMLNDGYFDGKKLDLNRMQARLDVLEPEIKSKRQELSEAKVLDGYEEHETTANRLTQTIKSLNEANLVDRDLLEELDGLLAETVGARNIDLESLYQEIGVYFPESVNHRLIQVVDFHEKISRNRTIHLSIEKNDAKSRIQTRQTEILEIQTQLSEKIQLLSSGVAIERLSYIRAELDRLEAEKSQLNLHIPKLRNAEDDKRRLQAEIRKLVDLIGMDVLERENVRKSAVEKFATCSKYLYEEPGTLIIGKSKGISGLSIETEILAKKSSGKSNMQIFCFDWVLAEVAQSEGKWPGFLIHDSHIFDGVDARQIGKALQFAELKSAETGVQYIVSLNSDDLPKIREAVPEFKLDDYILDTRLTDEETGGLFGVRF